MSGLPYVVSSWSRMSMIDILLLQPIRVGTLETLNWSAMLVSSMRKHVCRMFSYNWCSFWRRFNRLSVVVIIEGVANCVYTATGPGFPGIAKAVGSRRAYTIGDRTIPVYPCTALWGHTSCLSAVTICFLSARIFEKSGRGGSKGGFLRNSAASSWVMRESIFSDSDIENF